jgi:hypothetical protein
LGNYGWEFWELTGQDTAPSVFGAEVNLGVGAPPSGFQSNLRLYNRKEFGHAKNYG